METNKALTKDEDGEDVDVHLYSSAKSFPLEYSKKDLHIPKRLQFRTGIHTVEYTQVLFGLKLEWITTGALAMVAVRLTYVKSILPVPVYRDFPYVFKFQLHLSPNYISKKRRSNTVGLNLKDTQLPQTGVPQDLGADEAVHKEGLTVWKGGMDTGGSPRRQDTMGGTPIQVKSERVLEKLNEPPLLEGHTSGSGKGRMEHQIELTANVPITPHDSPLLGGYTPGSDEGRLKLQKLMTMCTKLLKQVLDLEKEKDVQAVEILRLKKRVKSLERQRKSSISQPIRRKYRHVESSDDDLNERGCIQT
ncbi:hypothetical protein Tco_0072595 [Tanacetum coccineum]